jgi:bacillithiol system protein YtxJ
MGWEVPVALKDRMQLLSTPANVDEFLARNPDAVLFKAGSCHKTDAVLRHVHALLDARDELPFGLIRVVEARPASNHLAALTGITHESPQLILFRQGKAVFDRDNWAITPESLQAALEQHFMPARHGRP